MKHYNTIKLFNQLTPCRHFFSTSHLTAVSPLDGRYHASIKELENYFSEMALMKYRTHVEAKWLIHLMNKGIIKDQLTNKNIV